MYPVKIISTGHYVPERIVTSTAIDKKLGLKMGTTENKYDIKKRHFASNDESTSFMGAEAAVQALENADLQPENLDCIISACGVMEQAIPSTAVLIQEKLGLGASGIPAFDINSTCLSFISALDLISAAIYAGRYKTVLIVSSEIASSGLDWSHPEAAAIFGDGAAAVIVQKSETSDHSKILASNMNTYGYAKDVCHIKAGGTRLNQSDKIEDYKKLSLFQMDGREAFKLSRQYLSAFIQDLLNRADSSIDDIRKIVPHQASNSALRLLQKYLNIDPDRVVNVFENYGNQIAASIPNALHLSVKEGRIQRGDRIMLIGTSAGISLGGIILDY